MDILFKQSQKELLENGYHIKKFRDSSKLNEISELFKTILAKKGINLSDLGHYHEHVKDRVQHLNIVLELTSALHETDFVEQLFKQDLGFIRSFLGPDILVQSKPHLRVMRPTEKNDDIGPHRDTFLGPTHEFINFWFPLTKLGENSGLKVVSGSHIIPSKNIHEKPYEDEFRKSVTKGSIENKLGYLYLSKTDDFIESLKPEDFQLMAPKVGSFLTFFSSVVHSGASTGNRTRWSIDLRMCPMNAKSGVRDDYMHIFSEGIIQKVGQEFNRA
jgi:hypothetical protein